MFNGDVIVITSATDLYKWFRGKDNKGNYYNLTKEDYIQLYRRISLYTVVTQDEIVVYNDIDECGKPKGLGKCYVNELAKLKKEKQKETLDIDSLFVTICESSTTTLFDVEQQKITAL